VDLTPIHFFDDPIEVRFNLPPVRQKSPPCPDGFTWEGQPYGVDEKLAEWVDFSRRGRMARNMKPAHESVASGRGSLGVGRFYFRVRASVRLPGGEEREQAESHIFDLYYDREIKSADDRLGHWFLYRELSGDVEQ
jgi:hypothetical protein